MTFSSDVMAHLRTIVHGTHSRPSSSSSVTLSTMISPAAAASAAIAAASLQHLQLLQADTAEAAGIMLPPIVGPSDKQIQTMAGGAVFMPWPLHKAEVNVPFFRNTLYKHVNLNVAPSQLPSGIDLPLNDITTLRFFFNLGVQQSRAVLLSQQFALMRHATASLQPEQQKPQLIPSSFSSADVNMQQRQLIHVHDVHPLLSPRCAAPVPATSNAAVNKADKSFFLLQHELLDHIFPSPPVSVSSSASSTISTGSAPFTSAAAASAAFPDSPIRQRMTSITSRKRTDAIRRRVRASSPSLKPNHFALAAASVAASKRLRLGVAAVRTAVPDSTPVMASGQPSTAAAHRSSQLAPMLIPISNLAPDRQSARCCRKVEQRTPSIWTEHLVLSPDDRDSLLLSLRSEF